MKYSSAEPLGGPLLPPRDEESQGREGTPSRPYQEVGGQRLWLEPAHDINPQHLALSVKEDSGCGAHGAPKPDTDCHHQLLLPLAGCISRSPSSGSTSPGCPAVLPSPLTDSGPHHRSLGGMLQTPPSSPGVHSCPPKPVPKPWPGQPTPICHQPRLPWSCR